MSDLSTSTKYAASQANYGQYLQYISDLDMSPEGKLELLYIVNSILLHFVDTAFGIQTDQITLQAAGKSSIAPPSCDTIASHPANQTADAQNRGVDSDSTPLGAGEP